MQLAGSQCCFCSRSVVLQTEATACGRCMSVAHKDCLKEAGELCPACRTAWLNLAEVVAYSRRCSSCGAVTARTDRCGQCGAKTAWDTHSEYLVAKGEIHSAGTLKIMGGSLALLAGVLFLAVAVETMVHANDFQGHSYETMVSDSLVKWGAVLWGPLFGAISFLLLWFGRRQLLSGITMLRFS